MASGPLPVLPETLSYRRYVLTDLLDDFRGATDPAELVYIACALLNSASEIVLLSESSWLGSGKWLGRLLAEVDARLVGRLMNGHRVDGEDPRQLGRGTSFKSRLANRYARMRSRVKPT